MGDYCVNLLIHGLFRGILLLPYRIRVPMVGWVMARVVAPMAGYTKRIRVNLAYTCPELTKAQVNRLCYEVPNNVGRIPIKIYSGDRFIARGYSVGAIYMPMKNVFFNTHYEAAIWHIGTPLFPRGRKGLGQLLKFLRAGGMTGFSVDQYMNHGALLQFFGKPAPTALSAAEMALKYDALLVPIYGIRQENGLDFTIQVGAPIPHSDAQTMTQALNDSLEHLIREHMGQWFWIHRRWKPERQRTRAAAKIAP